MVELSGPSTSPLSGRAVRVDVEDESASGAASDGNVAPENALLESRAK